MANVFVRLGDVSVLQAMVDSAVLDNLRLFKNNHVPTEADVVGDYTEANFSGYPGAVSPTWGTPFVNGSNKGEVDATLITYTHNGGGTANTVYGVYVVDGAGVLVYAERFPAPYTMGSNGDTFPYTPKVTAVHD